MDHRFSSPMNRQTSHSNIGQNGRSSGIRPPTSLSCTSSGSSRFSTPSTRKWKNPGTVNSQFSEKSNGESVYDFPRSNSIGTIRKNVTNESFQANASSAQSDRRSTISSSILHVEDSRPLSDPLYQRQCWAKLIAFLKDNPFGEYPHPIRQTLATRPTIGEITKIFEFLFGCFEIKSKITPMEVEIPKVMTNLKYPFPFQRSDLVTFTSGRALGSLLGMIEWIVDSLTVDLKLRDMVSKNYCTKDDFQEMIEKQEVIQKEIRRLNEEIQQMKDLNKKSKKRSGFRRLWTCFSQNSRTNNT